MNQSQVVSGSMRDTQCQSDEGEGRGDGTNIDRGGRYLSQQTSDNCDPNQDWPEIKDDQPWIEASRPLVVDVGTRNGHR